MNPSTPCAFFSKISAGIVTLVALAAFSSSTLTAQDRWQLLDLNMSSGFDSELEWPRPGANMFWRTDQIGYYRTYTETGANELKNYKTTDGGATWFEETNPDPIPHTFITEDFAYNPDGYITNDGGATWTKVKADYSDTLVFDDPTLKWTITRLVASSPENMVAFYQLHDFDASAQDSVPYGPFRMAFTQDAGETWTFVDSMDVFGSVLQVFHDSTSFGKIPTPEEMTNRTSIGWWELLAMPNDSIVIVGTRAFGRVGEGTEAQLENHYYLGKLNLNSFDALWFRLPFIEGLIPPPAAPLDFRFINNDIAYALQTEFVSLSNPSDLKYTFWRTENCGETWTECSVPAWVDYRSLRFVSESHAVTSNGYTNDGGCTWTEWGQPFENNILFYAYDSTHYFLANRFSLFASSTDAGRTWAHNAAGGLPQTVLASRGKVLVGRNYQSILISPDNGETWTDVGANGQLPPRLARTIALGFPDPGKDVNRIIGVATFVEYDASFKVAVIESSNGGMEWSVGQELPELVGATGPVRMYFVGDPESELDPPTGFIASSKGLLVSTNGGLSWSMRNDKHQFEHLAMNNPQFGSAITAAGLYTTDDGGVSWTEAKKRTEAESYALGLREFAFQKQKALFANKNGGYRNWFLEESWDGGDTWAPKSGAASRPMDVQAFWGDTIHLHTVGRTGVIQHSENGGDFTLENDSVETFAGLAGYVVAGQDRGQSDQYIYVVAPGNQAGRFRMYWEPPTSVPVTPGGPVSGLYLSPNPVRGNGAMLEMELSEAANVSIRVYDLLGKPVQTSDLGRRQAGTHREKLDLGALPNGHYRVEVSTPDGLLHAPIVIVH